MFRTLMGAYALVTMLAAGAQAQQIQHVIHISIDGGGSSYISSLISANQLPNFKRLVTEGAWTNNARCDYDISVTLPNHTTQITGRRVTNDPSAHGWTANDEVVPAGVTIHTNKGSYVASVFDVAHDNGLRTAAYAGKGKFSLFNDSYSAANKTPDITGPDNGCGKIDDFLISGSATLTSSLVSNLTGPNPANYAFIHFAEGDQVGHSSGWGSPAYNAALGTIDGYLGSIFNAITTDPDLAGHTAIILTADHGGVAYNHADATVPLDYTIPFYVWGPGVTAGAELYSINTGVRLDPGQSRPTYSGTQPIRNGEAGNLALDLLGLGAIPGSTIDANQDLAVPEPLTLVLLSVGGLTLARRRRA